MKSSFLFYLVLLGIQAKLPDFSRGVYLLLADNTVSVTDNQGNLILSTGNWNPEIGEWINQYNVVFFSFINYDLQVPPCFENARQSGQISVNTKIIYSIAGYSYSNYLQAWKNVFESEESAKQAASTVVQWNSDGIDIDIEDPAGNDPVIAENLVVFVQEIKRLKPNFIVTQPVFGYPQVYSQSLLTVKSWDKQEKSKGLADSIGIMVYSGSESLQYISNYNEQSCDQEECILCSDAQVQSPCCSVPKSQILVGLGGQASQIDINNVCNEGIGGYMVWYASVDNGFSYGDEQDARLNQQVNWNCSNKFIEIKKKSSSNILRTLLFLLPILF